MAKSKDRGYDQRKGYSRDSRDSREYDEEGYSEKYGYSPKYASRSPRSPRSPPPMRYDERLSADKGGCCSVPKLLVFLIFLGGGLGAFFGLVDLETIESWFGGGSSGSPIGGGGGGDTPTEDDTPAPVYEFMQCADGAECCNGLTSNCDLRVNEMLYATVHNA